MTFYLGTHEPHWLRDMDVPLFVSRRRLERLVVPPVAFHRWALDSGGFTELHKYGRWEISATEYARRVQMYVDETGKLDWAAPQDWMCEATALKRTGLTVKEHQRLTVENFLELRDLLGMIVIPVLQGWERDEYLECVDLYEKSGVDLTLEPVVGVGSICRRGANSAITKVIKSLQPLKLHGFGVKGDCYLANIDLLVSADSMAWSRSARYQSPLEGCTTHKTCANCRIYALRWREKMLVS